jgi:hypothetical protein
VAGLDLFSSHLPGERYNDPDSISVVLENLNGLVEIYFPTSY